MLCTAAGASKSGESHAADRHRDATSVLLIVCIQYQAVFTN